MLYIIENDIKFNTDDYSLEHTPTSEFIKLALPAGRLMEMIIKSNGEILSRDEMLTEVWDNYGLRGSNNNLSQYLSVLRKHMADFGCHEFIITIPKAGVALNKAINITNEVGDQQQFSISPMIKSTIKNTKINRLFFSLECIFYVITLCALYLYYADTSNEYYTGNDFVAYERVINHNCRVVFAKDYSSDELVPLSEVINKILSENNLQCNVSTIIYFDHYTSVSTEHLGRTLLSFCNIGLKKDITSCQNVYYYDRDKTNE